jgi:NADH-quinone oxidoreductase subunit L
VNKWYWDELLDRLFVAPAAWFGRFAAQTFERVFVSETLIGGTTGVVRTGSAAVRAIQSGYLRVYAALLILGLAAVTLYLLLQS